MKNGSNPQKPFGLAGNIYSEKTIQKIFETKKDPYLIP
jgi:hypothetical protein